MARLTIQQVQGPNMSAAGNMLAQAGASFDRGISSASDLLGKYQEGQQATGDAALTEAMLGVKNEEDIVNFLADNDLASMNLSPEMRQAALGLRDSAIGYAQGRADVRQTDSATGLNQANARNIDGRLVLAQAQGNRDQSDWDHANLRRDELSAAASQYAGALAAGQTYGQGEPAAGATDNTRLMLARTMQAEAGNMGIDGMVDVGAVIRNRAASGKYGDGIEGVIMRPGQFSAWNGVTGYAGGEQGQNMDFQPSEEALAAADRVLSGQYEDGTGGATHYYNPDISQPAWGSPNFVRRGQHVFGDADGIGPQNGNNGPIQTAPAAGQALPANPVSPAQQKLMEAVAQGSTFTFDDINTMFGGVNAAVAAGQTQLDATAAEAANQSAAQATIDALLSPEVLGPAGVASANLTNTDLKPTDRVAQAALGRTIAETHSDILNPQVAADPLLAAQAESDNRTRQREIDALPQTAIIKTAERYGDDPINGLIEDLSIGSDGETPGTMLFEWLGENGDENLLRQHVRELAEKTGVSQPIAAAAMRDVFERDPLFGNTNDRRFDPEKVEERIRTTVGPEGMREYEDALIKNETATAASQANQVRVQVLESQLAKANTPRERAQLQSEINRVKDEGLNGVTDAEVTTMLTNYLGKNGRTSRLARARTAGPQEYQDAIAELRIEIENDDSLSDREISLLISKLPG